MLDCGFTEDATIAEADEGGEATKATATATRKGKKPEREGEYPIPSNRMSNYHYFLINKFWMDERRRNEQC